MAGTRRSRVVGIAARLAAALAGLLLFVLSLEMLKRGASGVGPMLRAAGVSGLAGGIGAGWLGACLLLSGSPVAAVALTLLASGTLTTAETFGMISGSRLGAAFVAEGRDAHLQLRDGLVVEETLDAFEAGAFHLLVVGAHAEDALGFGREDLTERLLLGCPGSTLVVPH